MDRTETQGAGGQRLGLSAVEEEKEGGEGGDQHLAWCLGEETKLSWDCDAEKGRVWELRKTSSSLQTSNKQRLRWWGSYFNPITPEARYPCVSKLLLGDLYAVLLIHKGFLFFKNNWS